MGDKKSFVLRINPNVMKQLEKWAADDFRSLNGQIEYLLTQALRKNHRLPKVTPESDNNTKEEC